MSEVRDGGFVPKAEFIASLASTACRGLFLVRHAALDIQNRNERRAHQKFCANVDGNLTENNIFPFGLWLSMTHEQRLALAMFGDDVPRKSSISTFDSSQAQPSSVRARTRGYPFTSAQMPRGQQFILLNCVMQLPAT